MFKQQQYGSMARLSNLSQKHANFNSKKPHSKEWQHDLSQFIDQLYNTFCTQSLIAQPVTTFSH